MTRKSSSPNLPSIELQAPSGYLDPGFVLPDMQFLDRASVEGVSIEALSLCAWKSCYEAEVMFDRLLKSMKSGCRASR